MNNLDLRYEATTYKSGLVLYTHKNNQNPLVCFEICIHGGALEFGKEGLSNLVLMCLLKGSKHMDYERFSNQLESYGANLSLRSTPTGHYIRVEVLQIYFLKVFDLIWKSLKAPLFLESELKKEKRLVLTQLKTANESPAYLAQKAFVKNIYADYAKCLNIDGTTDSLLPITIEDLKKYYQHYYKSSNIVLSISGHISDKLQSELNHYFMDTLSSVPVSSESFRKENLPESRTFRKHIVTPDKEQCVVFMGHIGIARSHPDFCQLTVLDVLLGQGPGFSSRLPKRLRDEKGLVYHLSFSATQGSHRYPGVVQTYLECSPEKVETCLQLVQNELIKAQHELLSVTEVETIKNYLKGQFSFCFETNSQRCSYLLHRHLFNWPQNHLKRYFEQLEAITPETLQQAAQKHLKPHHQTIITAGTSLC